MTDENNLGDYHRHCVVPSVLLGNAYATREVA